MPTYTIKETNGDVLLANTMPEAEYMYGCTPTAVAMVLGYYDLYGYRGADLSNMIEGDVDSKSRGKDGNAYDMDAFDTALGKATATESFVSRFHSIGGKETTPLQELKYAFKSDNKTVNADVWDCIADYLGTGQYWRGNDNLATALTFCSLEELYDDNRTFEITAGSVTRTVRIIDTNMLYGLDLYVQSRGYAMDYEITGSYLVDVDGGSFTFTDYMKEIDEGRPVIISIKGHTMVGYGYNEDTKEIIFDNCYVADRRMKWDGTYRFDGEDRKLQAITVIGININGSVDPAIETVAGSTWRKLIVATAPGTQENADYCFAGTSLYLNYVVSNRGTGESGDFSASIRIDGELVHSCTLDSIAGGTDRTMQDIPLGELTVGMHNVRVILDEDNEVQEMSGSNNTAETDILVLKKGTSIVDSIRTISKETVSDVYVTGGASLVLGNGNVSGAIVRGTVTDRTSEGATGIMAQFNVSQDGYASGTDIHDFGCLNVSSGGTAVDTCVFSRGSAFVLSGGTARDVFTGSGGRLTVLSGGKLTGLIRIEGDAFVRVSSGFLDFDLSGLTPDAPARLNDYSKLSGTPLYTLTVSGTQEHGTYRLANEVSRFKHTITVLDTDGAKLGTIADGETVEINGSDYTLNCNGSVLSLTVSEHIHVDTVAPTVSNVRADITEPTWLDVTVRADFSDDEELAFCLYRIGTAGEWADYADEGVTVTENATVFFKAVDAAGNESEIAEYAVSNITSSGCTIPAGQAAVVLPGQAYTETVLSGGSMVVSSGGTASLTTVDPGGYAEIRDGAVADGVTVNADGAFVVQAGGKVTGQMLFASGADVTFDPQSILDFDISARMPGSQVQVNGFSLVKGTPRYTLTVSGLQRRGLYVLADDVDEFDASVFVQTDAGTISGILETGQTVNIGNAGYSLNRSDNSLTLTVGTAGIANAADSGWNNWIYDKTTRAGNPKVKDCDPVVLSPGTTEILPDSENTISRDGKHNFVGFCDEIDYMKINLDSAAKLSFQLDATDAAKFFIIKLLEGKDRKGNPVYQMKVIQATALTKWTNFTATTRPVLLGKGDYYICMLSSNAKSNGSAYYNVTLNRDETKTVFYSDGDNGDNNWLFQSGKPNPSVMDSAGITLKEGNVRIDEKTPENGPGWNNFVGFGDTTDIAKLDVTCTTKLSFAISATNAAKFAIYRVIVGKDRLNNPTYKLQAVQSTTLVKKRGETTYAATTRAVTLAAAENFEYYVVVQSTTAKYGAGAYYNVTLEMCDPPATVAAADSSAEPDAGLTMLSGTAPAGLQISGACAPAASPVPVNASGDLLAGLEPVGTGTLADGMASALA